MLRELDAERWGRGVMESRAGREALRSITFETLRQMGVRRFSWLPPQPEAGEADQASDTPAPLGGFAYVYAPEHAHHDCIFPLLEPSVRAGSDFVPVARLSSSGSFASPGSATSVSPAWRS